MPDLNELLRWSIANSTPSTAPPENNPDQPLSITFNPAPSNPAGSSALHPSDPHYGQPVSFNSEESGRPRAVRRASLTSEMLDLIMGKPDSVVMKEKMAFALEESNSLDDRIRALDDFEMLIEPLDNANNMAVLKLWEPLLSLLSPSQPPAIRGLAAWISGTACQNNLKAQAAFHVSSVLPVILDIIYPSSSSPSCPHPASDPALNTMRKSATNAFSSSLKHWPLAALALSAHASKGYHALRRGVGDAEPVIRRKMAFMTNTLLLQSAEPYTVEIPKEVKALIEEAKKSQLPLEGLLEGLKREGVLTALFGALKEAEGSLDFEFEENATTALVTAYERGALSEAEKEEFRGWWGRKSGYEREQRGLGGAEGEEITRILV